MRSTHARRRSLAAVFVFYLSLLLLSSSGRLASADAGAQLQASMLLVTAGRLGAAAPPTLNPDGWTAGFDGRYYEPHDIGAVLLLAPAAWLGHAASRAAAADFNSPPLVSRVAGSLSYAAVTAVGCTFFFAALALDLERRRAFVLSLLLPATTMVWPYSKTAWDVVGACGAMCAFVYFARLALDSASRARDLAGLAVAFVAACWFRYSLAPFLAVSLAIVLYLDAPRRRWAGYLLCGAIAAAGFIPTFVYNRLRTGSFLRPATASAAYLQANNSLSGSLLHGAWSLLFAPNRGLLVFAPLCLLLVGLPFVWTRLAGPQRRSIVALHAGALLYLLFIAKLRQWGGAFGWGPRLLLPILPSVMYGALAAFTAWWPRHRAVLLAFALAATLWQLPAVLTNWSSAIVTMPGALDQDARRPYQHAAVWRDVAWAIAGRDVPVPESTAADPERRAGTRFPDLWAARLVERGGGSRIAGGLAAATLVSLLLGALYVLFATPATGPAESLRAGSAAIPR